MLFILLSLPNDMIFDIKFNEQWQRRQDLQSNDCVFEIILRRNTKKLKRINKLVISIVVWKIQWMPAILKIIKSVIKMKLRTSSMKREYTKYNVSMASGRINVWNKKKLHKPLIFCSSDSLRSKLLFISRSLNAFIFNSAAKKKTFFFIKLYIFFFDNSPIRLSHRLI